MKTSKAELVEKAYTLGKEYDKTYRGCSQCVIAALQDVLEIRNDDIFKSATGRQEGPGWRVTVVAEPIWGQS